MILDEALNLSVPQFPHMHNQDNSAASRGLRRIKCVLPCKVFRGESAATGAGGVCSVSPGYGLAGRGQHPHYEEHELLPRVEAVASAPCMTLALEVPGVAQLLETFFTEVGPLDSSNITAHSCPGG